MLLAYETCLYIYRYIYIYIQGTDKFLLLSLPWVSRTRRSSGEARRSSGKSPDDRLVRETQGSDSSKNLSVPCVLRSTFSGIERSFSSSHIYATFRNISFIYIYI